MANPNTAQYPSAIVTDFELIPVTDSYRTTTVGPVGASDTSITVASIQNSYGNDVNTPIVLTIDSEQVLALSRSGFTFTSCTRGVNGTTAAAHAENAPVRGNVVADIINQLAVEVIALETLLGTNGTSIPARRQFMKSGDGNFTVPAGVTAVYATLIGGGGGGAGSTTNKGGGGGGAGEVRSIRLEGLTPGATITCTYGAGGTPGTAGNAGGDGGTTQISGTWTGPSSPQAAYGGGGGGRSADLGNGGHSGYYRDASFGSMNDGFGGASGPASGATDGSLSGGGAAGSTSAGTVSARGAGPNSRITYVAAQTNVYKGGGGGGCPWGIPGYPSVNANGSSLTANAGSGYGAGGGGGSYGTTTGTAAGSAGMPGCIIFEW